MAPKGVKRAAAKQASKQQPPAKVHKQEAPQAKAPKQQPVAKAAKKQEAPKVDPMLEAVMEVVRNAASLPESCKAMLLAVLPSSLGVASDERCNIQALAVSMVGELIDETRAKMVESVEAERTMVAKAKSMKGSLETGVSEAEAQLASAVEATTSKQAVSVEAEKALEEKTQAVTAARDAQISGDAELDTTRQEKERYAAVFENHFKALQVEEQVASKAQEHLAVLLPIVGKLAPDDSLQATLPTACAKLPSARGSFDQMVVQELEKLFSERIAALAQTLDQGASAAAERADAVKAAEAALEDAREARQASEKAVAEAQATQQESTAAVESAKEALAKFVPEYESADDTLQAKVRELEQFDALNVACFTDLRDKVAKAPAPVEPAPMDVDEVPAQAAEPVAEPATEPAAEPAAEPTTEPVSELAAESVAEPTAEPAVESAAEPAAEDEAISSPAAKEVAAPAQAAFVEVGGA